MIIVDFSLAFCELLFNEPDSSILIHVLVKKVLQGNPFHGSTFCILKNIHPRSCSGKNFDCIRVEYMNEYFQSDGDKYLIFEN